MFPTPQQPLLSALKVDMTRYLQEALAMSTQATYTSAHHSFIHFAILYHYLAQDGSLQSISLVSETYALSMGFQTLYQMLSNYTASSTALSDSRHFLRHSTSSHPPQEIPLPTPPNPL